jgi:transposase
MPERQVKRFQKNHPIKRKEAIDLKTKVPLSSQHQSIANIRENFSHQTSRKLIDNQATKVITLKDLGTKRMTRKPKKRENGKYLKNNRRAKAEPNKSILEKSWHLPKAFATYKAKNEGKIVLKKSPQPHFSRTCPLPPHSPQQPKKPR